MSKVRVASVGLGWWGKELARAAQAADLELVSCYARTPDAREAFAAEFGCRAASSFQEVLDDDSIDGILIATSNSARRQLVEEAAAAGKHVFVDKPMALSVEDARACVEAANRAGVVLQVGFQRRRHPAHRKMKQMIDEGEIGDIQMLEANHSLPNRIPDGAWRWEEEQSPLGSLTSLGIHQIENFHYLAGPIVRVGAFSRKGRSVSIDEATAMIFEFASGAVGTLLSSFFTPWRINLSVFGTEGSAFADRDGDLLHFQKRGENELAAVELDSIDAVSDQLAEFGNCVSNGDRPEVGGVEGLAVVAVLDAAKRSTESGHIEPVETI
jgi:predicted dehydrogenase